MANRTRFDGPAEGSAQERNDGSRWPGDPTSAGRSPILAVGRRRQRLRGGLGSSAPALLLGLAACSATPPDIDVAKQWHDTIRNYSLYPVYPMQESVQIGDVLLVRAPLDRSGRLAAADAGDPKLPMVKVGSASTDRLIAELRRAHERRLALPPTSDATADDKKVERVSEFTGPMAITARGPAPMIRMEQAALPSIAVARVTEASLGGSAFLGSIPAALGIGYSNRAAVTITLGSVEKLGIPASDVFDFLRETSNDWVNRHLPTSTILSLVYQLGGSNAIKATCNANVDELKRLGIALLVVNEVMTARSISYGFSSGSTFAGKLALSLSEISKGTGTIPALSGQPGAGQGGSSGAAPSGGTQPPAQSNRSPSAGEGQQQGAPKDGEPSKPAQPTPASITESATGAVRALVDGLAANSGGPGVAAKVGFAQSGDLSLNLTFKHPMAFGVGSYLSFGVLELLAHHHGEPDFVTAERACRVYLAEDAQRWNPKPLTDALAKTRRDLIQLCAVAPQTNVDDPMKSDTIDAGQEVYVDDAGLIVPKDSAPKLRRDVGHCASHRLLRRQNDWKAYDAWSKFVEAETAAGRMTGGGTVTPPTQPRLPKDEEQVGAATAPR